MIDRPVLVHYHIFKNAGTSVDVALQRSFGSRWTTFEGSHARDAQTSEQLGRFLADRPEVCAVSSHLARPPLPFPGCRPIVFLRHPLLRARSVYEFVRRYPEQPGYRASQQQSFSRFVEWALDADEAEGAGVIRDCQLGHFMNPLLGTELRTAPPTVRDLHEAKVLVESWGIVGIVEDYKTSARRFQEKYASEFPDLDFVDVRANRTSTGIPDVEGAMRAMREELGTELFDRLIEANQLDLELYDWAVRRFPRIESERSDRPAVRRSAVELADENEKLRDEVRYLTAEWETFVSRSDELAAQHNAIVGVRNREIAEHEALARAHNDLAAQYATLVHIRNGETAEHEALARAHNDLVARYAALVEIRNSEIAGHEALASVHNDLIDQYATLVHIRNGEAAEREALVRERDAMLASRSWRLTSPLRWVRNLFTRRSH